MEPDAPAGSGASATPDLHLWIINQYASSYPQSGWTRHHFLARFMRPCGIATTIVTDAAIRPGGRRAEGSPAESSTGASVSAGPGPDDPRFLWLPTRPYSGNGVGRMINMLGYAWSALRAGLRPSRNGLPAPDVVIGSSPQPFAALAGWLIARRHRVPFVLEIRDLWPESLVAILGVRRYHPIVLLLGAIEKFLYARSDRIVGVLDGVADHVAMRVGRKAPQTTWIPNGVALDVMPEATPLGEPGAEFHVVYAGAHGPPNSLDTLLRAAELLEAEEAADPDAPAFRFDLYGDGAVKSELTAYAERHGLRSVHFHDPVPKDEVFRILAGADAVVLLLPRLYLWRFGISPNKIVDYLAAGRPVILAVDSPGDPVTRAGAGIKATAQDPADLAAKIRRMAALPIEERRAMGERGRAYVREHHDMPILARRLAEVIRDVIAAQAGSTRG
jgi:glycosyltransferase involved in cell wall biosynthesis